MWATASEVLSRSRAAVDFQRMAERRTRRFWRTYRDPRCPDAPGLLPPLIQAGCSGLFIQSGGKTGGRRAPPCLGSTARVWMFGNRQ